MSKMACHCLCVDCRRRRRATVFTVALWYAATIVVVLWVATILVLLLSRPIPTTVAVMATSTNIPIVEPVVCQDTALLAQLVSAEARGETFEGQVAVANVVLNRLRSPLFPNTVRGVIFQAGQFCAAAYLPKVPTDSAWQAALAAMDGFRVVGENVLFFFNPQTAGCRWIRTREVATTIGRHRFALAQRGR